MQAHITITLLKIMGVRAIDYITIFLFIKQEKSSITAEWK